MQLRGMAVTEETGQTAAQTRAGQVAKAAWGAIPSEALADWGAMVAQATEVQEAGTGGLVEMAPRHLDPDLAGTVGTEVQREEQAGPVLPGAPRATGSVASEVLEVVGLPPETPVGSAPQVAPPLGIPVTPATQVQVASDG